MIEERQGEIGINSKTKGKEEKMSRRKRAEK
jgi:hypothetical protein